MAYLKSLPPHIRSSQSVAKRFWFSILALSPAMILANILHFPNAAMLFLSTLVGGALGELCGQMFWRQHHLLSKGHTLYYSALIFLMLPTTAQPLHAGLAAFLGILLGQQIFGGLGANPFHPAIIALLLFFPGAGNQIWMLDTSYFMTGALIFGIFILWAKKCIVWDVPIWYMLAFFCTSFLFKANLSFLDYLNAALLMGFFVISDPVTSPMRRSAQRTFAVGAAGLWAILWHQFYLGLSGAWFSLLIMQSFTPWLDEIKLKNEK